MNYKAWFAVLFPLIVMGAWTGKLALGIRSGKEVTFAIKGFDPRDLLSGHYLRYAVEWGIETCAVTTGEATCNCLSDTVPAKATWSGACAGRPAGCDLFVAGRCEHGRFEAGLDRFFIPETWQGKLARVPANATLQAMVGTDGQVIVKSLSIDGLPVADWVKAHREP